MSTSLPRVAAVTAPSSPAWVDRAVGLVEPRADGAERLDGRDLRLGHRLVDLDRRPVGAQDARAAAGPLGQRPPPDRALEHVAAERGPLRLGAERDGVVRHRGRELGPGRRHGGGDLEHELPRRPDLVEPEDPLDPPVPPGLAGHPPGRVEPDADARAQRVAGGLELLGQPHPGPRVRPGPQVDVGDRRGDRVDVDALHRHPERRHRDGIGPDAAAEVVHGRQRGVVEPPRVGRRDLEPGGLLEPVGGVEHVVGELAELRHGPGPQALLGQQRGDEVGVVALLAEPVLQAHHLALVVRGQASQDRPTVG